MTVGTLSEPLDGIVFDCDGTLSKLEAINFLATLSGVEQEVSVLTHRAMNEGQLDLSIYKKRLSLAAPTRDDLDQAGHAYIQQKTLHVDECIRAIQSLGKPIFIISAGLKPAVNFLAAHLSIALSNVFAVEIFFDEDGRYLSFDEASPMTRTTGKREVIQQLKKQHPRLALIGDGANDLAASDCVTRFVGFGGNYYHPRVASQSEFYIETPSLLSVLPLCLTESEWEASQVNLATQNRHQSCC